MKKLALKFNSWMERNLEEPFVRAEMARAVPTGGRDRTSTAIHLTVAAGLVLMVCWLFVSVV